MKEFSKAALLVSAISSALFAWAFAKKQLFLSCFFGTAAVMSGVIGKWFQPPSDYFD